MPNTRASVPFAAVLAQLAGGALHGRQPPLNGGDDPGGSRTRDLRIKSPLLYQLSYRVGDQLRWSRIKLAYDGLVWYTTLIG